MLGTSLRRAGTSAIVVAGLTALPSLTTAASAPTTARSTTGLVSIGQAAWTTAAPPSRAQSLGRPLVIGHRGAPGYRPEHTLPGYELAVEMGADYIEPDLVVTKDGVLVDRHEPEISATTDVASHPEFAGRRTTYVIDGTAVTGWFTQDFTLAELRTLRAIERLPAIRQHNTLYDGLWQVPTLQQDIDLVKRLERKYHRRIGIIPETKHPTFFRGLGLPLEGRLVRTLDRNGLRSRSDDVIIQSFEVGNLQRLARMTRVKLVQLTSATGAPYDWVKAGDPRTYADLTTPAGLRAVARYAELLGPDKNQIVPRDATGHLLVPTTLVRDAHRAGLKVTPYTFRNENVFLPVELQRGSDPAAYGNAIAEDQLFFSLGVDGIFTDNPDTGVLARSLWLVQGARRAA